MRRLFAVVSRVCRKASADSIPSRIIGRSAIGEAYLLRRKKAAQRERGCAYGEVQVTRQQGRAIIIALWRDAIVKYLLHG
jgi:hypothetical protein